MLGQEGAVGVKAMQDGNKVEGASASDTMELLLAQGSHL